MHAMYKLLIQCLIAASAILTIWVNAIDGKYRKALRPSFTPLVQVLQRAIGIGVPVIVYESNQE